MRFILFAITILVLCGCTASGAPRSYGVPGIDVTEEGITFPPEGVTVPAYSGLPPPKPCTSAHCLSQAGENQDSAEGE